VRCKGGMGGSSVLQRGRGAVVVRMEAGHACGGGGGPGCGVGSLIRDGNNFFCLLFLFTLTQGQCFDSHAVLLTERLDRFLL
jgi:hypothetical protein